MLQDSNKDCDGAIFLSILPFEADRPVLGKVLSCELRRTGDMAEDESIIQTYGIVIDPAKWKVSIEGRPVTLTKTEFRLLHFFARHAGVASSRQQIIVAVKGPDYPVTERSIDVHVAGLRKKLGDLGRLIQTVRGVGYRFRK